MRNNVFGFITYLLATILFSPSVGIIPAGNERKFRQVPLL